MLKDFGCYPWLAQSFDLGNTTFLKANFLFYN